MPIPLLPNDAYDDALLAHVKPPGWVNPTPAPMYNLVAIGAGAAGLVSAGGAGGLGGKAAIIERDLMGGDCLNVGCVPSKTLIAAAKTVATIRRAAEYGIRVPSGVTVDFAAVMERVRRVRADIAPHDSPERFRREYGVDVFLGEARFTGPDELEVGGQKLRFRKAVIATGGRASLPDIPGLHEAGCHTNENLFTLTTLPRRLCVIGGGPIACELGQAFSRLGSQVTIVSHSSQLLPREEPEASRLLEIALRFDGVDVRLNTKVVKVEHNSVELFPGERQDFDAILVAAGRTPNVEQLNLEAAGVAYDNKLGVLVSDTLRTTNDRIYAAGDICSVGWKFTHAADAMARLVLRNALFPGRGKVSSLTIPWCTFTDPEVARVGLSEQDAAERGVLVTVHRFDLGELDRAHTDGTGGFIQVLVHKGTDRIAGATIAGPHAGELIGTLSLAMTNRIGLKGIAATVFPYPTHTEALKRIADQFNRTRLTPFVANLSRLWLKWSR